MSSSSSHSTLSLRFNSKNPAWRSSSLSKNSAHASISLVVAEPEQGSPLASAASRLPSQIALGKGADLVVDQEDTPDLLGNVDNTSQALKSVAVLSPRARPGRAVSESIASRRLADRSPSTSNCTTRATHPSTMSLKPRKEFRRGSSSAWLASVTNAKGKEKEIAQPIVTLSPPKELKSFETPRVDASALVASTSSKASAEDEPQASTSTSLPNDIPPTPSVPPYQTPSTRPQTSDVTPPSPTVSPSDHTPSSDPPASDETQSVNCVNDPSITQNTSTETDGTRTLPEELANQSVLSADNRSWLGTWIGWGTSPSASKTPHGGSTCNDDPDVHRTDHDRQGLRHENESKSSSTPGAPSAEHHAEGVATLSDRAHGDLYQSTSPGGDQSTVGGGDSAVVPNCIHLTPPPPSNNHDPANPTPDESDTIVVPADPGPASTGKDANSLLHPSTLSETVVETSWWDYIGWRSSPSAFRNTNAGVTEVPPAEKVSRVDDDMGSNSNPDSGVGIINATDGRGNDDGDKQVMTSPSCPATVDATGAREPGGDQVTWENGGKGTALTTAPSQALSPSSGTHAATDSSLNSGMRGSRDESLAEQGAPSREGEKQDQGQDQLHVGGGAWFNPWSWYGSSYASDAARDGGERSSTDAARDGGERSLTDVQPDERDEKPVQNHRDEKALEADSIHRPVADESGVEHIPSEAEIQMTVADSSESVPSPSIMGTVEINPIVATMDTHRSSWLSFFASRTSRTLVVKSIEGPSPDSLIQIGTKTTEVDENGMEVMDISDDGVPPPSQPVPVPIEIPKAKEIKPTSPAPPSQSLVATLVRGRGKVRGSQPRTEQDTGSDTSSIKSVGQRSGAVTPAMEINGTSGTATPPRQDTLATAGSLSSSPKSTTSLVKRASLTLTNAKVNGNSKKPDSPKSVSPTPSSTSKKQVTPPPPPNLILPTWQHAFHTAPRNVVPRPEPGTLTKTVQYVSGMLFSGGRSDWPILGGGQGRKDKGKRRASSLEREREHHEFGKALPRAWDVLDAAQAGATLDKDVLRGCKRVVVIGVHGWFPGAVMRTVIGEPTGTSSKLANMMVQALEEFQSEHNVKLEKVTKIPLEGEGTINRRVDKLYDNLLKNQEWMDDIHAADAILLSTHSQGSVVSTHLLDRLISEKHIRTARNGVVLGPAGSFSPACGMNTAPAPRPQKICCLAMCGIHLGPLRYLSTTSLFQPYFQYIESPAARELFEFQNTEGEVSKDYVRALSNVLGNGVKMVYVASLNDQVVPIYSGVFTAASHPLILRALYIDGDAYHSSDFLANLLVLLLRILNSGISDSGLLAHLSEATAGSLNGVGHSTAYEEIATYALAVKYLFLSNDGLEEHPDLILEPFNARQEQNDYEIPWALRDVIADQRVVHFFSKEIVQLRDAFRGWYPRTSILRELKRKLQPIQRLPASFATTRL